MKKIFILPFLIVMMTLSFNVKAAPSLDETVEFMVNGELDDEGGKKKWSIYQCELTITTKMVAPLNESKINFNNVIFSTVKFEKQDALGFTYWEGECDGDCWEYTDYSMEKVKKNNFMMGTLAKPRAIKKAVKNFMSFCPGS